jgi:hypothetical protein
LWKVKDVNTVRDLWEDVRGSLAESSSELHLEIYSPNWSLVGEDEEVVYE